MLLDRDFEDNDDVSPFIDPLENVSAQCTQQRFERFRVFTNERLGKVCITCNGTSSEGDLSLVVMYCKRDSEVAAGRRLDYSLRDDPDNRLTEQGLIQRAGYDAITVL